MRATEIEAFLKDDLLSQVRIALDELQLSIKRENKTGASHDNIATEADVYNHLHQFFSRYYDNGDFMSLRRAGGAGSSSYFIPYNGEEVKVHWANADQYYIKSGENYASYIFTHEGWPKEARVRFEITYADNEKGDIKPVEGKERRFILTTRQDHEQVSIEGKDLIVFFDHRPLTEDEKESAQKHGRQDALNSVTEEHICRIASKREPSWGNRLAISDPTDKDKDRTVLGKHLSAYTAKNSFDYFIHKDIGSFLNRELDFYLKVNVLFLDDLVSVVRMKTSLAMMKAVRTVAEKLISFIAQIEDFQRSLWLKKKFVLETNYCFSLDRIPAIFRDNLYSIIADNESQRREWESLYAIDELEEYNVDNISPKFLENNPHLVVDTRFFESSFVDDVLEALSVETPLESQFNGLVVHGENYQALNLLESRYCQQVHCIYIDPPYNTDSSAIIYKNGYPHSSWMSLMQDRLAQSAKLLREDAALFCAIDDTEMVRLASIAKQVFPHHLMDTVVVNHNPRGAGLEGTNISTTHEYALLFTPSSKGIILGEPKEGEHSYRSFMRSGAAINNHRVGRPNSFYAVLVDPTSNEVVGLEPPPSLGQDYPEGPTEDGYIRIYPKSRNGDERVWRRAYESCSFEVSKGNIIVSDKHALSIRSLNENRYNVVFSNWFEKCFNAATYGTNLLKDILGGTYFDYPKSIYTVEKSLQSATRKYEDATILDYFAGSGTTGHAVMKMNFENGGSRSYILVEVGHHFDSVLLPRLKKVAYSCGWKNGKPVSRIGQSHCFRYVRLESYEDSLDSLDIFDPPDKLNELMTRNPTLKEDYYLRYKVSSETKGSSCLAAGNFDTPNGHYLSVVRNGVRRRVAVDLPETFNFLIGLKLLSRRKLDEVLAITGTDSDGHGCLVLWRRISTMDSRKFNDWFNKHRAALFLQDNHNYSNANRDMDKFVIRNVYANGDHNLNMLQPKDESWTAKAIEPVFRQKMFEGTLR